MGLGNAIGGFGQGLLGGAIAGQALQGAGKAPLRGLLGGALLAGGQAAPTVQTGAVAGLAPIVEHDQLRGASTLLPAQRDNPPADFEPFAFLNSLFGGQ